MQRALVQIERHHPAALAVLHDQVNGEVFDKEDRGMTDAVPETLSALPLGQKARVISFDLPPEQHQRLLEMGLTVGAQCEIVRFAPLGDPIELKVRGGHLSIRKAEAAEIHVEKL